MHTIAWEEKLLSYHIITLLCYLHMVLNHMISKNKFQSLVTNVLIRLIISGQSLKFNFVVQKPI